jgi:hypothetical protein
MRSAVKGWVVRPLDVEPDEGPVQDGRCDYQEPADEHQDARKPGSGAANPFHHEHWADQRDQRWGEDQVS